MHKKGAFTFHTIFFLSAACGPKPHTREAALVGYGSTSGLLSLVCIPLQIKRSFKDFFEDRVHDTNADLSLHTRALTQVIST